MSDERSIPAVGADDTHTLVTQIARALVDHPEAVLVQAVEREECTILRLHVSESDIGKVIGKQGRTAHSLRTILSAVSMKYHHRYTLDIVENNPAPHAVPAPMMSPEPPA
ncbi:KH domain-containing protein [Acidipila sp. EB88]|uniref:KH domain-containing protein n=1 Tax=Acidipila sp. EB88 TaxID=2305226 RepID=UPI000F5FD4E5|nr:KH domain-containing protein [Acidipila sp. EB88]RRA47384.1 KH domain-containing protein [Acidipila sp. EB88]